MVEAVSPGYITADVCSRLQAGPQTKASGNHGIGGAVSNLAVVPVDADGRFCIYTQVPIHLVADVQGAFGPSGPLALDLVLLTRRIDTRSDGVPAGRDDHTGELGAPRPGRSLRWSASRWWAAPQPGTSPPTAATCSKRPTDQVVGEPLVSAAWSRTLAVV